MKLSTPKAIERRKRVIVMREQQLQDGTKPNKFGTTKEKKDKPLIQLSEDDRTRIKTEIEVLKKRV